MLGLLRARLSRRSGPAAFGLDIGSAAVKVLELRAGRAAHAVARCARVPLAPGLVSEGAIRDTPATAAAIRAAVEAAGIRSREAAVGICGRELIIKKLQIPEVPARDLPRAIQIEAEHQIPFAIDEVFLGYQITARQDHLVDLTLVAAKKSKVGEYCAAVRAAGLDPVVVDVDGFALGNQHELASAAEVECTALVDVGATMTKIAIVGHRLTHFVRDLPIGGDRYTQAIAAQLGVAPEAAEAIKTGEASSPAPALVAEACARVSRELGREIQRALDYHAESDVAAASPARVLLLGGAAGQAGLGPALASVLELPVAVADPFAALAVDSACATAIGTGGPALALALGLGLRRSGDGIRP
jgi:type IV pilus assembly protein PilM